MTITVPVDPEADARDGWQRLHLLSTVTGAKLLLGPIVSLLVGGLFLGRGGSSISISSIMGIFLVVVTTGLGVLLGVAQRRTTRYRIGTEFVESHNGIFFRKERSIPRDRIRTVELTAPLFHRALGLVVVRIGSGESGDGEVETVVLDAVSRREGQDLQGRLLRDVSAEQEEVVLTMRWRWLRLAPLSVSSLVAVGVLAGMFDNVTGTLGLTQQDIARIGAEVVAQSLLTFVLGGTLIAGVLISLVLYTEAWWGYRLVRKDRMLQVERGLLTRRSVTLDESRIRGVEVREPVLMRFAQGGSLRAIATGAGGGGLTGRVSLSPPADLDVVHDVSTHVLGVRLPLGDRLSKHPEYAIARRLNRGSIPGVLLGLLAYFHGGEVTWILAGIVFTAGVALGWVSYANLGHQVTESYLLARRGFLARKTVALHKDGILGWIVESNPFQRRRDMCTLTALTAAGRGGYSVPDITYDQAKSITESLTPGLAHWT